MRIGRNRHAIAFLVMRVYEKPFMDQCCQRVEDGRTSPKMICAVHFGHDFFARYPAVHRCGKHGNGVVNVLLAGSFRPWWFVLRRLDRQAQDDAADFSRVGLANDQRARAFGVKPEQGNFNSVWHDSAANGRTMCIMRDLFPCR